MASSAPAVTFGVKVIEALTDASTPVGISEISRQTGINKNMVSRILHALEDENWVRADEKCCYSLTLLPFCLTGKVVGRTSLVSVAVPLLQRFWSQFGESTYLGVLHNDEVLYLSHFDSVQPIRVAGTVGGSYPLYCTAPGKVLLAYSSDDYKQDYLQNHLLKQYTKNTVTKPEALCKELATIRKRGYSFDNEEYGRGIVCMAAPLFDHQNAVIGVIGCSFSTVSCEFENIYRRCGAQLLETAQQISKCMGCVQ